MVTKEFQFYVKADLSKYKRQHVAIVENRVVASGENAKEVLEKATKEFPHKTPLLAKIPKEEALYRLEIELVHLPWKGLACLIS